MRVLILGADGYIGFSLALALLKLGHYVCGVDNGIRRIMVDDVGGQSVTPIVPIDERHARLTEKFPNHYTFFKGSVMEYELVSNILKEFKPDAIVHLAEQPSAPYSMRDVNHAIGTQSNNVLGTLNLLYAMKNDCPDAHLVKLGSMGEYGTPTQPIPEGDVHAIKLPGSFYHASKVADTYNINLACRIWGLRCTDIMQGVVYGLNEAADPFELTRFDCDEAFGTAINRFMAQAVAGVPLTVYGKGGQTRGFLPLVDSIQCLKIVMDNPPESGEHRVVNQFEETYSVKDLAARVEAAAKELGIKCTTTSHPNPRIEKEEHTYEVTHRWLLDHGYAPTSDMQSELKQTLAVLKKYKRRISKNSITLDYKWA